jgi:hypothetical protein
MKKLPANVNKAKVEVHAQPETTHFSATSSSIETTRSSDGP